MADGTLTGYSSYQNNVLQSVATGLSIDAVTAANFINAGNVTPLLQIGLSGNDLIHGSLGSDTLIGYGGNDVFIGGGGNDTIIGGSGTDTVIAQAGYRQSSFTNPTVAGTLTTPTGTDRLNSIKDSAFVDGRVTFDNGDHGAQVARLYLAALGRTADQGGLASWTYSIDHRASLQTLAAGFLGSPEFAARFPAAAGPDSGAFVEQLYQNVLHRGSDAAGKAAWVGQLDSAALSRANVLADFSESPENQASSALAAASGIWVADPIAAQVARLYDTAFGRLPDTGGLSGWTTSIEAGSTTLSQVAGDFVTSPEFLATYGALNASDFVTALYVNTLHRQPDQAGLAGWVNALAGGVSRGDVVVGFSESPEHMANTAANVLSNAPGQFGIKFA